MTVFVVVANVDWVGTFTCSLWSTRELAETEVLRLGYKYPGRADEWSVEEMVVDGPSEVDS